MALEKSTISAADIKFLFGQHGSFGPQCGEGKVLHLYDFEEFVLLESGSAFGKGKEYPHGDYCIEVQRSIENICHDCVIIYFLP